MEHFFGNIEDGEMVLNDIGRVADQCMKDVSVHFPHVVVDEFIIMPNHVHVILVVDHIIKTGAFVETQKFASLPPGRVKMPPTHGPMKQIFGPQIKNLGSIVRGFKIGVQKYATMNNITFKWQSNYYDHIIRNDRGLWAIRRYIRNNPQKRYRDRNNSQNLYM